MLKKFFSILFFSYFIQYSWGASEYSKISKTSEPEFLQTLNRSVLAAHKKGHKYHPKDQVSPDMALALEKVKQIKSHLSDRPLSLVLGIHPYEAHPLIHRNEKDVFFLNETLPAVPEKLRAQHESRFFHLDFNSEVFRDIFAPAAKNIFSSIYFDWSTFKFANEVCLKGLYDLLPAGGRFIVPEPVTLIFEIRKEGETSQDFWALSSEEKYKRNLDSKISLVKKAGFAVKIVNSTEMLNDPIFQAIASHLHTQEGKEKPFKVLIAIKKPVLPPKPRR